MILKSGNMWTDSSATVKLFTGNATVTNAGKLVMGRGAALQARGMFPGCNQAFGSLINGYYKTHESTYPYGVLVHPDRHSPILGVFQVKWHFHDAALPDLISYSVGMLSAMAQMDWRDRTIALNYPGIGYGGLTKSVVAPLIESLPDNVEVWTF